MNRETHTIDATNKSLGRLASKIAKLLRGKHKPSFNPREDRGDFVRVKNVDRIKLTGKKLNQKIYYSHSGYPGGLKKMPLKELFKRDPGEVLRRAVKGMLPNNKLSREQIKRLEFVEKRKSD